MTADPGTGTFEAIPPSGLGLRLPNWLRALFIGRPILPLARIGAVRRPTRSDGTLMLPEGWIAPEREMPRLHGRRGRTVDLVLPDTIVLCREVAIPAGALGRRRRIAEIDLMQRTPFAPGDVLWTLGAPRRDEAGHVVTQAAVQCDDLGLISDRLARQGYRIREVLAVLNGRAVPLATSPRPRLTTILRRLNMGFLSVAGAAAIGAAVLPMFRDAEHLSAVEVENARLQGEAVAARAALNALQEREGERGAYHERVFGTPAAIDLIREITVALPDDTWVSEMALARGTARLSGERDGSAAELVLDLGRRHGFEGVRLEGPVTRNASGGERFTIAFDTGMGQ